MKNRDGQKGHICRMLQPADRVGRTEVWDNYCGLDSKGWSLGDRESRDAFVKRAKPEG